MNDLNKDTSKNYLNPFFKITGLFLILYIFIYTITFSLYYLGNNYDELSIKYERFSLILDVFTYFPSIIFIGFSIIYLIVKKKEISFIEKKEKKLKNVVLSLLLIYFVSFVLDPFYHNFNMVDIPLFELKLFTGGIFLIEALDLIIVPVFEELFFRDLLLRSFLKKKSLYFGIIITSILYSISHFYVINSNFSLDYLSLIKYLLIGVVFSILRIKYGLLYGIFAHIFYNLLGFLFYNKIVNLYLLDYIKSNYLYWGIYVLMVLTVLYSVYRLLGLSVTQSKSQRLEY